MAISEDRLYNHMIKVCKRNLKDPGVRCCADCPFEDIILDKYPGLVDLFEKKQYWVHWDKRKTDYTLKKIYAHLRATDVRFKFDSNLRWPTRRKELFGLMESKQGREKYSEEISINPKKRIHYGILTVIVHELLHTIYGWQEKIVVYVEARMVRTMSDRQFAHLLREVAKRFR